MQSAKIIILLVDDNPKVFFDRDLYPVGDVTLPEKYERYFSLYWIKKPEEARWLLDTYNEIYIKAPEHLINIGLPPEILIFDYALSQSNDSCPKRDNQKSNIIKQLQDYIKSKDIKIETFSCSGMAPSTGTLSGSDRMGCYIGGIFARTFSDYHCGAIPTTAGVETLNTDAAFFEWLNEKYLDNAFLSKKRPKPTWEELINAGVNAVRKKIIKLTHASLIAIKLDELQLLSSDPAKATSSYLSIYSRLGCREIPIAGLFVDASEDKNADNSYEKIAKRWADDVLTSLFKNHDKNEFYEAKELAKNYFDAFLRNDHDDRYELAYLVAKCKGQLNQLGNNDKKELIRLCNRFGVEFDKNKCILNPEKVKVKGSLGLWKNKAKSDAIARWSALMLIIKAEQFYSQNSMDWSEIKRYDIYSEGLVKFKTLVNDFGEKEANRLVESLKLDKIELELHENESSDIYCQLPAAKIISLDDVLVLLDPLPENLLTFYNKGKDFKRDTTAITGTNSLVKLKLNIDSVLRGESENGLVLGEGNLLKLYAHEIGYDEKGWPSWLRLAL